MNAKVKSQELIQCIFWGRFTEKNAVEMLELFLECMPEYNIDRPDGDGKPSYSINEQ